MTPASPYTEPQGGPPPSAAIALVDDEQVCQALHGWLALLGMGSRYFLSAEACLESVASEMGHWRFKAGTEPSRAKLAAAIGPTPGFTCLKKPFTLDTLEQALFPL